MLFLQPMLVNARALLEGLFPRPRATEAAATSASEVRAIGVPGECAAPPSDPRLEAALVMRRVRHFHEDKEKG
jgi:hypothetical protein